MWFLCHFNAVKLHYEEDVDMCAGLGVELGCLGAGPGVYFKADRCVCRGGVG